jgi:acetyltransferase-like isoleucine patch superfamily enzyme
MEAENEETEGFDCAFVKCVDGDIWNVIKPKLGYHLMMSHENSFSELVKNIDTVESCTIEDLSQQYLSLRFGFNSREFIWLKNQVNDSRISIGDYSYGNGGVNWQLENPEDKITIGKFCSIASNVSIFGGAEHYTNRVTTYPLQTVFFPSFVNKDACTKGETIIGNDVWIGHRAIILSGALCYCRG